MLRIKKQFKGMIISRMQPGVGTITFDPNYVNQEDYDNFLVYGFDFIFEEEPKTTTPRKNSIKKKIELVDK